MSRRIDYKYLPARPPLFQALTVGLLLDRFDAPGWMWGAMGVLWGALLIGTWYAMFSQKLVHPTELPR